MLFRSGVVGDGVGAAGNLVGLNTGNSFARGKSMRDLVFDPSPDHWADMRDVIGANMPVTMQAMRQSVEENGLSPKAIANTSIIIGSEFLGASGFGPTLMERAVTEKAYDLAIEAGLDPAFAKSLRDNNEPAWKAKGEDGLPVFTREQVSDMVARTSADLGLDEEVTRRGGTRTERERTRDLETMKAEQTDAFFRGKDGVDTTYSESLAALDRAYREGRVDGKTYSGNLKNLRMVRAGGNAALEKANPAAIALFTSDANKGKKNAKDAIYDAISDRMYDQEFFDPETQTFDFDAQRALRDRTAASFPGYFEEWQAIKDRRKSPLELERDRAFDRMAPYFAVSDQLWQTVTGGALGASERDLNESIAAQLAASGVDQMFVPALTSRLKSQIPAYSAYTKMNERVRKLMRLSDPQLDADATTWLGTQSPLVAAVLR